MTDREALISALEGAPDRFVELVSGASSEGQTGGRWDQVEIFRHVKASDAILSQRILQILVREHPPLLAFDDRAWGDLLALSGVTTEEQLLEFRIRRQQLVDILRSLADADWLKSGIHEVLGEQTIEQIVQHITDHEAEHFAQLSEL